MMSFIKPYIEKIRPLITRLNEMLNRLRTKIPGLPSNRVLISAAALVSVAVMIFAALQILVAPEQPVTTYTLPYTQTFDDVNLKRWFSPSGVWTLRTGTLMQTVGGEEAGQLHIPLKVPEDAPYHVSVFITLKKDTKQSGLSFNAQYPDLIAKQHRAYIDRINAETLELVAGYMDETGAFVTQARVPLSMNTTEFRLDIYVYSNSYLVQVNGQRMIENRPLFYKNGMLGFYALGSSVFDNYKLTTADNQNPGDMVYTSDFDQEPGGAGWVPISGSWQIASKQMLQSDSTFTDAAIGYETSTFENYTLRATFNHLTGQGAGVFFNMPSPYSINGAHLVRYSDETDSIIWGYYDSKGVFTRQGFVDASHPGKEAHILQIFSGTDSYDIFLDEEMIARDVPLVSIQGAVGLVTSRSSAAFSDVEVFPLFGTTSNPVTANQPSATPQPTKAATQTTPTTAAPTKQPTKAVGATPTPIASIGGSDAPYRGVFDGKLSDAGWKILNGDWKFADGNFVQTKVDGFDFATVYTKTAFQNFSIQTGFVHVEGSGAGILFNMPSTERLAGGSMVRYSDKRDNAIVWGYFDENGVYQNQGYADVPNAGTDRHTLRIIGSEKTYSIYLDDRLIVQAVPYKSGHNAGYFGLVTSRAHVTYDEVVVDGVGAVFQGTYDSMDGFTDQRIISGKWTIENAKAIQTVSDVSDYVWNTGVQASEYTISAKISLPAADDSGGGFIIHMGERGSKNNSYIVRFKDGGKAIWWGSINDEGKFKGQGSAPIENSSETLTLKLVVKLDTLSIFVNDAEVAKEITISSQEGWIGLLAYGGPVTFEDVKLEVEK
ncbi:MAG: hypothetical protein IPG80_18250 [Anaerolineales bacterium]|uniref:family 16 glycoside hydrolase n=1 Tax=Candidatus Villigracilis vicinus TaxID=3140679 RepID=UPI003136C94E|nr:hypothetical protein [Anaerolineales bacterium]